VKREREDFYILLFLVGVTRCFFLLFDPYDVRGLLGPVGSQILFGFPIACLVNVYILIIRLWINMYNAVNYQKTLDHVFRYAGIAMALVFLVEFGYDLMDGLFGGGIVFSIMLAIYVVVLGLGVLILAVLFSIYSQKLYRRLKKLKNPKKIPEKTIKKVNVFAVVMTFLTIVLILCLSILITIQIVSGENPLVILISQTCQRPLEISYCLLAIVAHWRKIKTPNTTQQTCINENTSNDDKTLFSHNNRK